MNRRQHDRLNRPGRRRSDRRPPAAENRRVLLVGTDEAWRLLATYVFEEAGYVVYAAANERQAAAFTFRLLPDVVVMQLEAPDPDLHQVMDRKLDAGCHGGSEIAAQPLADCFGLSVPRGLGACRRCRRRSRPTRTSGNEQLSTHRGDATDLMVQH